MSKVYATINSENCSNGTKCCQYMIPLKTTAALPIGTPIYNQTLIKEFHCAFHVIGIEYFSDSDIIGLSIISDGVDYANQDDYEQYLKRIAKIATKNKWGNSYKLTEFK